MDVNSDALAIGQSVQTHGRSSSAGYTFLFALLMDLPFAALHDRLYYEFIE
jgi:hypothetical protein